MSELKDIFLSTCDRLLGELNTTDADDHGWPRAAWQRLVELGLPAALTPQHGDDGLSVADALAVSELCGYHTLALPLPETLVANRLLALAGLPIGDQPLTLAATAGETVRLDREQDHWRLHGELSAVPWGRHADAVVLQVESDQGSRLVRIAGAGLAWRAATNLADDPRDDASVDLRVEDSQCPPFPAGSPSLLEWGALIRALQMSGAMRKTLKLAVDYANERVQFGRPIARFQAIQHQLAVAAGQLAAATAAAEDAARRTDGRDHGFSIAVAKARVGEAAGLVAAIGHQVHGAMGYTREHTLHHGTRRLWSWRDEYGNESFWQTRLGTLAASGGGDGLWATLTALQDSSEEQQ
ncbi:acyl-CoA dehydrogenase family protein [Alloalcanivorax mobilis]|uniref:acyl-CoA dehydrogenase family protein n=1 Tax=Alloalcanivorax mobilis TaxID=2019569 RepID=UPI000C778FE5|nr:acyl-CoA dehydrogenase family protein [Alloalcanivorax mobilis]